MAGQQTEKTDYLYLMNNKQSKVKYTEEKYLFVTHKGPGQQIQYNAKMSLSCIKSSQLKSCDVSEVL